MAGNDRLRLDGLEDAGDIWSILLVVMLARAPGGRARFSELQKMIEGISQRMLTTTLRNLERDGSVTREIFPQVPPRVEYELTDLGLGLLEPMQLLVDWIGGHWPSIKKTREKFDAIAVHEAGVRRVKRVAL